MDTNPIFFRGVIVAPNVNVIMWKCPEKRDSYSLALLDAKKVMSDRDIAWAFSPAAVEAVVLEY